MRYTDVGSGAVGNWAGSGAARLSGEPERVPDPTPAPLLSVLYEQRRVLAAALDEYGWHRSTCPAYEHTQPGELASECDDPWYDCTCGLRELLALVAP